MSKLIVAFGHRKRTGKDTAATMLIEAVQKYAPDIPVRRVSFASKLKAVCFEMFGWAGLQPAAFYELDENAHLREEVLPKVGKTPRQIWIEVGNKIREVFADIWVCNALLGDENGIIVVSDLRYLNEADIIEQEGGLRYKMYRPGIPISNDVADVNLDTYTKWTEIINNVGDLEELRVKIDELAQHIIRDYRSKT